MNPSPKEIQKMIKENKTNLQIMKEFGYTIKENKKLYNRIIYERSKCK